MEIRSTVLAIALLATSSAAIAESDVYTSIKLLGSRKQVADMTLTSPRVNDRITRPQSVDRLNGSIAVGYAFSPAYRLELEYTLPSTGDFVARWAPFVDNDNVLQARSQRLMINGYRHWAVGETTTFYGMAGIGQALIRAQGWQTRPERRFEPGWTSKTAYSLGVGMDHRISKDLLLDLGYRYVLIDDFSTSPNLFANAAMARDEQLKGRLGEHNVHVGLRMSF
jgi:opacity protein-like surface antigen